MNVISFCLNQNRLKIYSCCKIVLQDNNTLYISCVYRSKNSTTVSNDLLNQTIADVSKLKGELFQLDFNYPNINGRNMFPILLKVVYLKFFTAIQNSFLYQHVSTGTHSQPNRWSTLIDLIFTSDGQLLI